MAIKLKYISSLVLTLAVIILSAFIREKNLPGFYYSKDCLYNLTLLDDSTFQFKHRIGYQRSISTGTWRIDGENNLILKSNYMDILNTPFKVTEGKNLDEKDSIYIKISSDFVNESACFYVLIINDSTQIESNNSYFYFKKLSRINSLKLLYTCPDYKGIPYQIRDTVGTIVYNVNDANSNVYEFDWNCNDDLFYYEVFNNDTLDIKNKYLYFRNKNSKLFKRK